MKKTAENIRNYIEGVVDILSAALFVLLILIGLYAVLDIHAVTVSARIDDEITNMAPDAEADVDMAELQQINPEIRAWIQIPQTKINYPVVQAKDNIKYLTRNVRGEYATAGSIFLDSHNDGFRDDFSIVYGHRMDGQNMFGGISLFEDEDYFDSHPKGVLHTEDGIYDLEISDFAVVDINRTSIYNHENNRNGQNAKVIKEIKSFSKRTHKVEINEGDKIIILSTCDKDSRHFRNVLLTKMVKRN